MLIPVQYHNKKYPSHIRPRITEVAGHFDIEKIIVDEILSIHTEYSYGKRRLSSNSLKEFPAIISAQRNHVPMLWINQQWAIEFAGFIQKITMDKKPAVIEIHPPFNDYLVGIDDFLVNYVEFESKISDIWPDVDIVIENRSGTTYKGGNFLISRIHDLVDLVTLIDKFSLRLNIALDIPQLFTAYGGPLTFTDNSLTKFISRLIAVRHKVKSIHLWGKKRSSKGTIVSHVGDLNTYFDFDNSKKKVFLNSLISLLDDEKARYFVPEVNSNSDDLHSIVEDLENAGINFIVA
jgi:hypothetical protein